MKLSIITINKNNCECLKNTIKSVLGQSFEYFEFIVIDATSDDGSVEIIKKYEKDIDYWTSEPDNGIYQAMNKGIKKAKSEYCLFLNSGDWLFDENVLASVFNLSFDDDIIYGHQLIQKNTEFVEDICLDPQYLTFGNLRKSHLPHQSTFIKRNLFQQIGLYNENNKIVSDWEFMMVALFRYNCSIRRIDVPIAVYDLNGISNSPSLMQLQLQERKKVLAEQFPRIIPDYQRFDAFLDKPYIRYIMKMKNIKKKLDDLFNSF